MMRSDDWLRASFRLSEYRGSHVLVIGPDNEARRALVSAVMRLRGTPEVCWTSLLSVNPDVFPDLPLDLCDFELGFECRNSFPLMGHCDEHFFSGKSDLAGAILSLLVDRSAVTLADRRIVDAVLMCFGGGITGDGFSDYLQWCLDGGGPLSESVRTWALLSGPLVYEVDCPSIWVGYGLPDVLEMPGVVALLLMTVFARRVPDVGCDEMSVVVSDVIGSDAWRIFRENSGLNRARLFRSCLCLVTDELPAGFVEDLWGGFWKVVVVPDADYWKSERGQVVIEALGLGCAASDILSVPDDLDLSQKFYLTKTVCGNCEMVPLPKKFSWV